jgi:parallel beta-helix repeat protein
MCLLLLIPLVIQIKLTSATIITVPTQYARIKDAVNNAVTGDTIQVDPGIYYENNIIIESTITALSIVGASPTTTIIDGMGNGTIFDLDGTNVYITGFTIRNAGNQRNAIMSEKPGPSASNDYHRIINNIITTSAYGISLGYSSRNTIYNNTFLNNPLGAITISSSSSNNNMTGNIIKDSAYGIKISNSPTNTIALNDITFTSYSVHISGATATDNTISRNTLAGRTAGVYSSSGTTTIDHNMIIDGSAAIYLQGTSAQVNYNKITNSSYGIRLYYSSATTSSHNIRNNKVDNSDWAIELTNSNGNTFQNNWLQENTYGVFMSFSSTNTLYRNNFVNNVMQAFAGTGSNTWSSGGQGNYWSDYTGTDANHDGIGDTSYLVSPIGQDNFPLMTTWSEHDIEIKSVTPSTNQANQGAIVDITVVSKNRANITVSETFTVTTKYNSTIIETKTVYNLAKGATNSSTFHWNTAGVAPGNYIISAEASIVTDELNTDNNKLIDGTVTILQMHDVAILNVQTSRTMAYAGYGDINIEVDVKNEGQAPEEFYVTAHYNSSVIGTQLVTLDPGATTTLTFTWNTQGVTPSNYTISATADQVPGETHISDNTFIYGTVHIRIPGDINGDKVVDLYDAAQISAHWYPGPPTGPLGYDPIADIDNDGNINIIEAGIVSANWGKTG